MPLDVPRRLLTVPRRLLTVPRRLLTVPRRLLTLAATLTGIAAACLSAHTARADTTAPPGPGITVSGGHLFKGGVRWIPSGVQIVGLVAPEGSLNGKYVDAHAHFGAAELNAADAAHADLVRFQVSEFGLDPQGPLYSPAYVQQVRGAVEIARGLGMAVIVSLQAQAPAGEPVRCPLPDAGAERAWNTIAPMFAGDSEVMFELYNEPAVGATQTGWSAWLNGGPVANGNGSCQAVGMQTLITDIRSDGANNVIVVPGLAGEQTLGGMPRPTDPATPGSPQLVYGIHYPSLTEGIGSWDRKFGRASASVPVLVTEWNANSTTNCLQNAPVEAPLLLHYLAGKGIGVVGFAFDLPGTVIADWSYAPTSYAGFKCGVPGGGPGRLLFNQFTAYARTGNGVEPQAPPAWMVTAPTLKRLATVAAARTANLLDSPRTFVTGASASLLTRLSLPNAVPTATFTDERKLAASIRAARLPAGTAAVVYDDEASSVTPKVQQLHPDRYFHSAAQAAHSHNLLFIATAATGLVNKSAPHTAPGRQYPAFLRLRISAAAARYADVYEIQGDNAEMDPAAYASFVRAASAQASSAHPGVELLTKLSTNPKGQRQPISVLLTAALSTPPLVAGYALDDPTRGRACPTCTGPYPNTTLRLVDELRTLGG